jgi:WD40 repeat protein
VRLWDARTHKPLGRLSGHTGAVSAVAFSPDAKTIASASNDKTVRLWDARTHKPLGRLSGHTSAVSAVAFSPDAKTIASASYDKTVRVWDELLWRGVAELRATVCDILVTGLPRSDWEQYASGTPYRRSCP